MSVVGFVYTKIHAQKKQTISGKVDINNNVSITKVEHADLGLGKQQENAVKFTFDFKTTYQPEIGEICFEGEVMVMEEPEMVKEIVENWEKSKKVPQAVMTNVINTVLNRSNVQALILSRDINLPPPIPLPKVQVNKPGEAPTATEENASKE